jgi:tripartite-type tricarboxylate transporter receptor subunit TctC
VLRSALISSILVLFSAPAAFAAQPQSSSPDYPNRPIRLISPFVPGGGTDVIARQVATGLNERWGQAVIVDNRGGAGGMIGTDIAAHSPADGYTLVMATASTVVINPLVSKAPFDVIKDFAPVAHINDVPLVLVVHPSVQAKTVKEFITLAKSQPGKFNFASSGEGTISQLAAELFRIATGTDMVHVPYKGGGQAIIELVAGHVETGFVNILEALPQVKAGRLRALAVTTAKRSSVMPAVPTVAEGGVNGYQVVQWSGVLAPAHTPATIVSKLNSEISRLLERPDFRDRLQGGGAEPAGGTPQQFQEFLQSEIAKWAKVIKAAKITTAR